ncbi:MAG: hypothetical protein KIT34_15635 [Cyanobacteria bacterium TGS_CYA1]|nr:hypothetical protein [Cyanobacteria bacterium TGS_CYA1]
MSKKYDRRRTTEQKLVNFQARSQKVLAYSQRMKILGALFQSQEITKQLQRARRIETSTLYEQVTL